MKKLKKIKLREWLDSIDVLSEPVKVYIRYPGKASVEFTGFTEVRRRINPFALDSPIRSVWIGRDDDGIVITLEPPKQYDIRIG